MDMLDSENNPKTGHADILREYGALVEKIDKCFGDINLLKHEIEKVEERRRMEIFPDEKTTEKYNHTIKMLTEAQSYIKGELSIHEKRAMELRPALYGIKNRYQ